MHSGSKNLKSTFFHAAACLIITICSINAEIRYVSKTGGNAPPYLNWQTAAINIQDAVNHSGSGDTIFVALFFWLDDFAHQNEVDLKNFLDLTNGTIK